MKTVKKKLWTVVSGQKFQNKVEGQKKMSQPEKVFLQSQHKDMLVIIAQLCI